MIEPVNRFRHRRNARTVRNNRPFEHDDRDAQRPRGADLAVRRLSPTVFGNHGINGERLEQRAILTVRERAASEYVMDLRHGERRVDRIHAADDVMVLRCRAEWIQLLPPDRQKDPSWLGTQYMHGLLRAFNFDPVIARHSGPRRPTQREQRSVGSRSSLGRVCGDGPRIGMRRVDQEIHMIGTQKFSEPVNAAKSAAAHWNRLFGRRSRAAGKRHRGDEVTAPQREPQLAGFGGASQDQNMRAHGHRP